MTLFSHPASTGMPADVAGLGWMISQFARETRGVLHAMLLASDGLAIVASDGLDPDQIDKTAATAGSLLAVANAMSREFAAGSPEILTFRTPIMHFLLMDVADRAGLVVLADRSSNLGVVGNEMRRLVAAVGERLNPGPRPAGAQPGTRTP